MSDKMQALGRRWAALGLEWLPGMLVHWQHPAGEGGIKAFRVSAAWTLSARYPVAIPDFTDRLTELALLVHVQQAWADPRAYVMPLSGLHTAGRWAVCGDPPPGVLARMAPDGYPTWAEACIAAVEATRWRVLPIPTTPEEWLAGDDTGISSLTIYSVMTGVRVSRTGIPHDSDDFGRCHRLLSLFPEWRGRLGEVAARFPEWRGLVEAWGELEGLYEQGLLSGDGSQLYLRMLAARTGAGR